MAGWKGELKGVLRLATSPLNAARGDVERFTKWTSLRGLARHRTIVDVLTV